MKDEINKYSKTFHLNSETQIMKATYTYMQVL